MAVVQAIQDKLLTQVSRGLFQADFRFVSESVFPKVESVQNSGKLGYYDKEHLRIVNTVMGGRAEAARVDAGVRTSQQYYIEPHGLADVVTQEDWN
jgi:hypothetical protein